MKLSIKAGTTSKLLDVFIQDSSSVTGAGLTGLVYNTSSLTAYYYREGAASATVISLATMTLGTWATSGFVVIDGTNMPGCYQIGIPDAAIASGAKSVLVYLKGATNMAPLVLEIELTAVDNQSATAFITGVNSLAPPTNWNLESIDSNGRLDVIKVAGASQTARDIGATLGVAGAGLTALGDTRIANLDATVTSRMATYTQPTGFLAATFPGTVASTTNITAATGVTVSTNSDKTGYALTSAYDPSKTAAQAGDAMALTSGERTTLAAAIWNALTSGMTTVGSIGKKLADWAVGTLTSDERTAIANEVEAQIIDDTDSEKVLTAITDKIAAVDPDLGTLTLSAIASSVWSSGTRTLTAGTNIVLAKGTGVTGFNDLSAAQVNAEADTALSDVGLTATVTGRIDVATSTRLADADYTAPDNASIAAIGVVVTSVAGDVTDVLADTSELQTEWSDGGRLDLILDSVASGGSAPSASDIADEVQTRTINANIEKVNGVTVSGSGAPSDPWGP